MLPDPPQLLLGLFSDQQIPVRGSRTCPPGQFAAVADGAAVSVMGASIHVPRQARRSLEVLVPSFMSMFSVARYAVILVCSSMSLAASITTFSSL